MCVFVRVGTARISVQHCAKALTFLVGPELSESESVFVCYCAETEPCVCVDAFRVAVEALSQCADVFVGPESSESESVSVCWSTGTECVCMLLEVT
jgi:hypothetical protein